MNVKVNQIWRSSRRKRFSPCFLNIAHVHLAKLLSKVCVYKTKPLAGSSWKSLVSPLNPLKCLAGLNSQAFTTLEEGRGTLEGPSTKISPFMQIPCLSKISTTNHRLTISILWREKMLQGIDVHGQLVSPGWKTHIKNAFEVYLGFPLGVY